MGVGNFHVFELLAGCVGVVGALLVVGTFWLLPKFREHPAELILFVSICDLFLSLKFLVRGAAWLAPGPSYEDARSFHLFNDGCTSSIVWSAVFETASISWNAIWCLHLMYQTRFPDRDASVLVKFYHVYVWAMVAANIAIQLTTSDRGTSSSANGYHYCSLLPHTVHNTAIMFDFVVSMASVGVALCSLVYTWIRLGCGVSKEVHALALRHYAFCLIFIFLWTAEKSFVVWRVSSNFHTAVGVLWQAQGFFVALIRLSEPGLLRALLRRFRCRNSGIGDYGDADSSDDDDDDDMAARQLLLAPWSGLHICEQSEPTQGTWGASSSIRAELAVTDSLGPVNARRPPPAAPSRYKGPSSPRKQYYGDL
ncbi:hypothetical protein PTSG_01912 [Salpingoeca rosetta]|uniref:G-protein coupled receptors family 2 profile 2 domain-containing protein n=1 Tax=Salpingoeca rosetta (strain ATCC 50818 / BSB-021) TaxID=946362 RepID=F2TZB4_SALR5|nr:uncharacterized protein PTSG_01912 [Salpingoeca rosetta]EGD78938.1 hypothetical protein PTSG_01912 [Salpingoeca rosetta]|eukprot:XP_004997894.1 hypothetical protein PTSG_01912 [Salpingoeca rosetta]